MSRHSNTPNRLSKETSPYLLQHAYNPVDWYPWEDAGAYLFVRPRDEPVSVLPSSNTVSARNFMRLGDILGRNAYLSVAEQTIRAVTSKSAAYPAAVTGMLSVLGQFDTPPLQITIVGDADHPDTISMIDSIRESGIIKKCLMLVDSRETETLLKALCPGGPAFGLGSQAPKAVVCFGTACQFALENPRALRSALSEIQAAHSSGRGR